MGYTKVVTESAANTIAQATTGNAATTTALATARAIGGVDFDGTAAISLPGVNAAGNQATSGLAATATLATTATNVVVTDNESTNEANSIVFVAGADIDGSTSAGLESDGNLTYNPSTGGIAATLFTGNLTGIASAVADDLALGGNPTTTTQAASNNSTRVATTAYADAQAALGDTTLNNTKIWIGSSLHAKAEFALSGDVTMTAGGAVTVADNAITLAKMAGGTDGNLITYDTSGNPAYVATGTATHILTSEGADKPPIFKAAPSSNVDTALSIGSASTTVVNITSDGGVDDVTIPTATSLVAGVMSSAMFDALDAIEASATADQSATDIGTLFAADSTAVTFGGAVTVTGNLTVSGTTTTVNTATLEVEDQLIKLANVVSPDADSATGAGIQIEASATEADFPELKWIKAQGCGNTDGTGTANGLTGWSVSNMHTSNPVDIPIAVMEFSTNSTAPTTAIAGGIGSFHYDSGDSSLYIRTS